jgi:26S proteasome regulatory subunit N11
MNPLMRMGMQAPQTGPPPDTPQVDTAEQVQISSLALLKMLKHGAFFFVVYRFPREKIFRLFGHTRKKNVFCFSFLFMPTTDSCAFSCTGRAGVPMEVMGLMLGQFVDDYTVKVVDVFAMPQSGTGVSVEAVDPVFQTKMLDMLKQTGREEMVVGWYHSHPGFGCWLSGVDINTQQSFEQLNPRLVAVVIDPIQSVKGKVVIDAFRLINPQTIMLGQEPRQTTSNLGHLNKPSIAALIHGLNRHYYSINIGYRKNELEEKMLLNLDKPRWSDGLKVRNFTEHRKGNEKVVGEMRDLADKYQKAVQEEAELTKREIVVKAAGRTDAKKRLSENANDLMAKNITQQLGAMLDTVCF